MLSIGVRSAFCKVHVGFKTSCFSRVSVVCAECLRAGSFGFALRGVSAWYVSSLFVEGQREDSVGSART